MLKSAKRGVGHRRALPKNYTPGLDRAELTREDGSGTVETLLQEPGSENPPSATVSSKKAAADDNDV